MQQNEAILAAAQERFSAGDLDAATGAIETFLYAGGRPIAGMHLIRGLSYAQKNQRHRAYHAFEAELAIDPASERARDEFHRLLPVSRFESPRNRRWDVELAPEEVKVFERGAQRYTYRGVPMVKNCFDFALYPLLLHKARPATIIEVGTFMGGSAMWLADMTRNFGIESHVYSIEPFGMPIFDDPRVTFMQGDGRNLAASFGAEFLAAMPRPLMVIDDADHEYVTSKAILEFFDPLMRSGEYIVVEDGLSAEGPRKALGEFFGRRADDYEVDAELCDYFAYNATWCINGYLKRK
jgi:cephalosporin hydroxylase